MSTLGKFYGIGVGPGEPGLIPVAAWEALQRCDVIFLPRAQSMDCSVARRALPANDFPPERFREIEFNMDPDRAALREHYRELAETIAAELRAGKTAAWLTLGDPLTYSTYSYALAALLDCLPGLEHRTFPGITSYSAVAAATDWPLGEGKERVLILPCPESVDELRAAIEANDAVVLMKIGARLPMVLALVREMGIDGHCAFGRRVGMPEELLCGDVRELRGENSLGYLSTMLIRKTPRTKRHTT
jgi:precorrin-2/cobalt-factor-2 C20-methyltransferase